MTMPKKIQNGKLLGIAIKKAKRAQMILKDEATITTEKGVEGDYRGNPGNRQVTVVSKGSWDKACKDLNQSLPWIARRANLLVDDIILKKSTGSFLKIGKLVLEITGETEPCHRMDEFFQGLQEVLKPDWRGGVTCRVINSGYIRIDDTVIMNKVLD